jgi:rhodanese-related sulfurtransferase
MNYISRDELKAKVDQDDSFKLVMTLNEWSFRATHIPGSINVSTLKQATELLQFDDEIVVYCSGKSCPASQTAYHFLVSNGYSNVKRYAGGLSDWQAAGYPLEGEQIASVSTTQLGQNS